MNPTNTRASHGETREEWLARAENVLRLTLSAAEHSAGVAKASLLGTADELNHKIQEAKSELAGRTRGSIAPECINGDIKFAFGNDTTLFMGVRVNECDVAVAIAPRIDRGV
jgi:hypothetical protein